MIARDIESRARSLATQFPALVVTGPRQNGKSTLCRSLFPDRAYATLETPDVRGFALEDPRGFLARFPNGAILDEIQNAPPIASYLQEIIDRDPAAGRWILTGSQNFALSSVTSQSLAGRAAILHLLPMARSEVVRFAHHPTTLNEALFFGGYPRILDRQLPPSEWLASYVATYLERDVRSLAAIGDLVTFQRFVQFCGGRTSQLLNVSALASDAGVSQPTAKSWLSVLEASFLAFRLMPYHSNVAKRLIKMPKLHFYDSGLACWLLGIRDPQQLDLHPLKGAIFESWAVSEVSKALANRSQSELLYYYRDKAGTECDLLVPRGGTMILVEIKSGQTPQAAMAAGITPVATVFSEIHQPTESLVIYGGSERQERNGITFLPWHEIQNHNWAG